MPEYMTCIPAYGRDYTSAKAVLKDWNDNKDFQIATYGPDDGRYINKSGKPAHVVLHIRYARLTKIVEAK